jgi:transposase
MLNAEATISFFRKIEEAYPRKNRIHIFCDNVRYYRNKAVTEYLKTSKIQLHFLPPYSPHLNPIERLWKWMKERVIYNTYYPEFEDFRLAVFGFFAVLSTLTAESVLDLLRNSDSVDFRVLLSQFSIQLAGTIYEC